MILDHIGVAVRSAAEAEKLFAGALGGAVAARETVRHMNLSVVKVRLGGVVLELLEPQDGEEVVSKFLATRGEGIHHICYEVADLEAAVASLRRQGYAPIWEQPRLGSAGKMVQFLRPKQTHGVLIELAQKPSP